MASDNGHDESSGNRIVGSVKWFNVNSGYGFINREDNGEDVFVHFSAISAKEGERGSLKNGEQVEFCVVRGEKGDEACEVTAVGGGPVEGSPFVPRGRGGFRGFRGRGRRGGSMYNDGGYYGNDYGRGRMNYGDGYRDVGYGDGYRGGRGGYNRGFRGRGRGYGGRRNDFDGEHVAGEQ